MNIPLSSVLLLLLFALLLSTGQVLFKVAAVTMPAIEGVGGVLAIARNPYAWIAVVLYGSATVLWIVLLQSVPLSVAYPFVALGFVVVPLAARVFFGEPLSLPYMAGVVLILGGIWLTQTAARS